MTVCQACNSEHHSCLCYKRNTPCAKKYYWVGIAGVLIVDPSNALITQNILCGVVRSCHGALCICIASGPIRFYCGLSCHRLALHLMFRYDLTHSYIGVRYHSTITQCTFALGSRHLCPSIHFWLHASIYILISRPSHWPAHMPTPPLSLLLPI